MIAYFDYDFTTSLFLTPPSRPTFAPQSTSADMFVLQVRGASTWALNGAQPSQFVRVAIIVGVDTLTPCMFACPLQCLERQNNRTRSTSMPQGTLMLQQRWLALTSSIRTHFFLPISRLVTSSSYHAAGSTVLGQQKKATRACSLRLQNQKDIPSGAYCKYCSARLQNRSKIMQRVRSPMIFSHAPRSQRWQRYCTDKSCGRCALYFLLFESVQCKTVTPVGSLRDRA
jgi:hypothetical protein